jgi:type III restriction enzyme
MALHRDFPTSPYAPLVPSQRWFPADETLRDTAYAKLLPPLVAKVREEVYAWRQNGYRGASATSASLLRWWFETEHLLEEADGALSPFRYYFAQREAVESLVWLYDVRKARDKFDLLRFDASGAVSGSMFNEDWPRYVLKMATGAGKTKVLSLLIAWSFFHRLYEVDSTLSRNFLVIAPNIIVLDRLRADFDGLRIFFNDPVLPANGHDGRNWRDDFQVTLHIQDDVRAVRETGNIFLTNIHRVFLGDVTDPSLEDEDLRDYFLDPFGARPVGKTTDSKTDLGEIVREVEELAVFNDEAHHIHDPRMAWFKSIQDIHHRMLQKDRRLAIQVDVTATPRHDNGEICPELQGAVLVIHTKKNGEISEAASGKSKDELELLRKQSNEIDSWKSPYKAIVSVLVLKEGWDEDGVMYRFAFVGQKGFEQHTPSTMAALAASFTGYQP